MPKSDGSPLDPLPDSAFDGEKYLVEIKPSDHKCKFKRISSNEIRCECGKGYRITSYNVCYTKLLRAFFGRKKVCALFLKK